MLFYKILLTLFIGTQIMAANHIYFHKTEIYNANNCYTNLLCELLVEVVKNRKLENNTEIMNFIDSIDQDKYGRGAISSRVNEFFALKSPNLKLLHELLNEVATLSDRYREGNSTSFNELIKAIRKIAQGKPLCRMRNYPFVSYINILTDNIYLTKIKNISAYESLLNAVKKGDHAWHYVDIDDYFETGSQDLLVLHDIIDLCIEDNKNDLNLSHEIKNNQEFFLKACQERISKFYYGETY